LINECLLHQNSISRPEKNILDIGAGTGDFLKVCKVNLWNVFGIEPDMEARNIAAKKGVLLHKDVSHFTDKKFEIITLWHVLEHVENLEEYISTLEKLLSKNGTLIIAVPNYKSYDAKYYSKFWAAFDVPRHLWHFSETSISKLFAPVNLTVEKTLPMKFDAYYISLLSEKYKYGSMKPISALFRGFVSNIKAIKSKQYSSLIYVLKKS
jgi:2-polyprenyl-3-methyl-5-hydroxy-6-metoxy-1,4-benzoquinol methylase